MFLYFNVRVTKITEKFDVLRGRLLGNHNDFHVKLFGYDFHGHTRGTLVVGIAYGCPYCKGSAIFSLVFLSTTSEKSFTRYKASATVQALKICPVRPRVLSSWAITLLEKLRAADES